LQFSVNSEVILIGENTENHLNSMHLFSEFINNNATVGFAEILNIFNSLKDVTQCGISPMELCNYS